jgi:pimeloyl-ACP methyl ester carboxylesterase
MMLIGIAVILSLLALSAVMTLVGAALIERAHPPAGRFVDVGGSRLHVVELDRREEPQPDDPPVVLLHGASGNLEDLRLALGDALSRRHRVILVDRPGLGWSEPPPDADAASLARQAALVSELLERLDIGRAIIVSHSLAGAVATALALDDPFRVAGLVLIAPVSHPWPGGIAWYYRLATTPVLGPLFARTIALPVGLLLMGPAVTSVFAPQSPPHDYVRRAAISLVFRPKTFLANARDVARLLAFVTAQVPRYASITAPTIIITGDRDVTVSPEIHARALAALLPHGRLVVLEGVGHMAHHVAAARVVEAIDELAAEARAATTH